MSAAKEVMLTHRRGIDSPFWKGGRNINGGGYVNVPVHNHPMAKFNRIGEHVLVAESALGKYLPIGTVVHHVNGVRHDNSPENLVICQDHAYHMLLHRRTDALKYAGNANARKCWICKEWGLDVIRIWCGSFLHKKCRALYDKNRRAI